MNSLRGTSSWTFLTHHALVLLMIARDPQARLHDIAAATGVTERTAQNIVRDLHEAGYLTRERIGRRNHDHVDPSKPLRATTDTSLPVHPSAD